MRVTHDDGTDTRRRHGGGREDRRASSRGPRCRRSPRRAEGVASRELAASAWPSPDLSPHLDSAGRRPGDVYDPPADIDKGRMFGVLGLETDENVIESVTLSYDCFELIQ